MFSQSYVVYVNQFLQIDRIREG